MDQTKLKKIIEEKNEQRERSTLHTAEGLIEAIVNEQKKIAISNERIVELRNELAALRVEQLDPSVVLGS